MNQEILLDNASLRILQELQRDARQTVQQLADAVGLSSTPCWKRIKDMEAAGVIRGYTALVDRSKVGLHLLVVAEINLSQHSEELVGVEIVGIAAVSQEAFQDPSDETGRWSAIKLKPVRNLARTVTLKEIKAEVRLPVDSGMVPLVATAAPRKRPTPAASRQSI